MRLLLLIFSTSVLFGVAAQEFYPTNYTGTMSPPAAGLNSCSGLPGTLPVTTAAGAITFDVTGVGTLNTTTNTLYRVDIDFNFDFGCGSYSGAQKPNQDDDLQIMLVAPDGTCSIIYNADWASVGGNFSYSLSHNQVIGLGSVGCSLQTPTGQVIRTDQVNYTPNTTSNYGLFASLSDLTSTYNGVNADGRWTILVDNTSTNRPFCISSVNTKLFFADNELQNEIGNGGECVSAVEWNGSPTCLTTAGQPVSTNLPGWNGGPDGTQGNFDNFNNGACLWNAANNNSIWIEFTPDSADEICLSINGISGTNAQQSIIVTDPNTDSDNNPCTGAGNGSYWDVVSCPNGPIYSGTSGSTNNQMHCFVPTPGQTYYIVIDGSAGAPSEIFLYGVNSAAIALPVEIAFFKSNCINENTSLSWATISELNNDYFTIERSVDGLRFEEIGSVSGMGTHNERVNYNFTDNNPLSGTNYYRLKQTDFDGKSTYIKMLASHCTGNNSFEIYPNPIQKGKTITITGIENGAYNLVINNPLGENHMIETIEIKNNELNYSVPTAIQTGMYILQLTNENASHKQRLIIQ